ncbi:MAG: 30S ribosomal protein S20 [Deltaproteobacteria bacterium]|nr:30S ribosomal protein S20 [Deltaproteobacteria bacterium]
MATHASAIKRHKQSEKRNLRNKAVKAAIKTATRNLRGALANGKKEEAGVLLKTAVSLLDKAVTRGVLHRNNASRRVSRLTSAVISITSK